MPVTFTWTGHATFLIDTGSGTILVDPFLDECPTASIKAADVSCDVILITHAHFDHLADAAAIANRTGAVVACAFEIATWLGKQGVENTCVFSDMERIGRPQNGRGLDLAILPIGDVFTMGPEDSLEAIRLLGPRHVLPCHYSTWPPIAQDATAWAESVRREKLAEPHVLAPGETFTLG